MRSQAETPQIRPAGFRGWSSLSAALGTLTLALLFALAPAAAEGAVDPCQGTGTGAGQCANPQGVATDFESERLYVAEQGNHRVSVFEADGDFLFAFGWGVDTGSAALEKCTTVSTCQAGIAGSGAGQFSGPRRIAVDNTGGANQGDIYVGTDNFRVQRFKPDGSFVNAFGWGVDTGAPELQSCTAASTCQAGIAGAGECQISATSPPGPISVGPGGDVFLADNSGDEPNFTARVQKFSPAGVCLDETVLLTGDFRLRALAVDSAEDAYVTVERASGGVRKYDLASKAKLCEVDAGIETNTLALDGTDRLFVSQREKRVKVAASAFQVITEYNPSCEVIRRFGYGEIENNLVGLAALHTAEGDIFASEGAAGVHYLKIPLPGPIIAPESLEASPVRSVWAALKAEVNPEGKETEVLVEYVSEADYEAQGDSFEGPNTVSSNPQVLSPGEPEEAFRVRLAEVIAGCKPFSEEALAEGKCLEPQTDYRFRVLAKNADGEDELEGQLTTRPPLEIEETYASDASTDTATLNVHLNPLGSLATGWFEYVTEAAYQESGFENAARIPDPAGGQSPLEFGSGEEAVKRSATIHPLPEDAAYRYRFIATDPFATLSGPERAFTTFKEPNSDPCPDNGAFRTGASVLLPDCRAYEMVSPVDKGSSDVVVGGESFTKLPAVVSQSAVSGERLAYGALKAFGDAKSSPLTSQYIATRNPAGSPTEGWQSHGISPPQDGLISGFINDNEYKAFSDDLCQSWIIPHAEPMLAEGAIPGYFNLYRRQDEACGGESFEAITTGKPQNVTAAFQDLELQGRSEGGETAVFAANDSLEGSEAPANPGKNVQLYVKAAGSPLRFACILPGGVPSTACSAGTSAAVGLGTNRLANLTGAFSGDGRRLFWSNSNTEGRIFLRENPTAEGPECVEASSPCTTEVSKAAEEEAGTSKSHFWAASVADGERVIFSSGANLYEFEVEVAVTKKIAGGFIGFLGASEDASRAYFASADVLTGEEANSEGDKAQAGKANLYLHEAGPGAGGYSFVATLAGADVDPKPLGGDSSATATEPRLHNGRTSGSGLQAAFMSTAPLTGYDNADAKSGQADNEVFLYDAAADGGAGALRCVSCNPSGARPAGANLARDPENHSFWIAARLPVLQNSLYSGRLLSDDGSRLFFESQDALVVRDTNSRVDVYQWEEEGSGSCTQSSSSFAADSEGCIDLISSGQGIKDVEFIDASPSGNDVFFATISSLLPQDYGLIDIYDARVGGGFPPPPALDPGCEGEACQGPTAPPEDPTPASSAFRGAGNMVEPAARPSCRKGKVKRKGRCVKRKAKRARGRHRQAHADRRAGR